MRLNFRPSDGWFLNFWEGLNTCGRLQSDSTSGRIQCSGCYPDLVKKSIPSPAKSRILCPRRGPRSSIGSCGAGRFPGHQVRKSRSATDHPARGDQRAFFSTSPAACACRFVPFGPSNRSCTAPQHNRWHLRFTSGNVWRQCQIIQVISPPIAGAATEVIRRQDSAPLHFGIGIKWMKGEIWIESIKHPALQKQALQQCGNQTFPIAVLRHREAGDR